MVAERLSYRFIDTDEVAEFMIDMPIADFFAAGFCAFEYNRQTVVISIHYEVHSNNFKV